MEEPLCKSKWGSETLAHHKGELFSFKDPVINSPLLMTYLHLHIKGPLF